MKLKKIIHKKFLSKSKIYETRNSKGNCQYENSVLTIGHLEPVLLSDLLVPSFTQSRWASVTGDEVGSCTNADYIWLARSSLCKMT